MNGRKLLRIFLWFLLIILLLSAGIAGYAWWQKDALVKALIDNLNQTIEKPVQVETVSLSLEKFPSVSLRMEKVWALDNDSDSLLNVDEVLLSSSLRYWIKGEYRIDKVAIRGGSIHLKRDANGNYNYQQFIPESDSTQKKGIELTELTLNATSIIWDDAQEKVQVESYLPSMVFQTNGKRSISISSTLQRIHLEQGGRSFDFEELGVNFTQTNGVWETQIELPESAITLKQDKAAEQILFEGSTGDASQWLHRLNIEIQEPFTALKGTWKLKGSISTAQRGSLIQMTSSNLQLDLPEWNDYKGKAALQLETNSKSQILKIDSVTLQKKNSQVDIDGSWNLKSDRIALDGKGQVDLSDFEELIPESFGSDWKGSSAVEINYSGNAKEFNWNQGITLKAQVEKLGFDWSKDIKLRKTKGNLEYSKGTIKFSNLLTELNGQELFADGTLSNVNKADKLNIQMRLRTQSLIMSTAEGGSESLQLQLPRFTSSVIIEADELKIDDLKMSAVRISLQADSNQVNVERLFAQGIGGQLEAKGQLKRQGKGFALYAEGDMTKVAIDQLFEAFSDFGQKTLTSKQLEGTLSSDFQIQMLLDASLQPEMDAIKVIASSELQNAELSNFKPLETVAENVQLDELNTLRISNHKQNWSIENQKVYLEKSMWRSNAIDVEISGIHQFDNTIDYQFSLPINRLVSKRKSQMDEELEEYLVEVQERKQPKFYVRVTGTVEKPVVSVDKEGIKEGIKTEWKNQDIWKKKETEEEEKPSGGLQFEWGEETDSIR